MTLLDYPGKVACTLFTGGCNFRCPFCHNALLVTELDPTAVIPEEEILSYLEKRKGVLDGVCVTGGEPLLMPDLLPFLRKVKEKGYAVKLDTNGSFPERLREIVSAGVVDKVAMDVKNCREKYGETIGLPSFDPAPIDESIAFLLNGTIDYEFRTTVSEEFHSVQDIVSLAEWIRGAKEYHIQNFVDSGNLIEKEKTLHSLPKSAVFAMRDAAAKILSNVTIRGIS